MRRLVTHFNALFLGMILGMIFVAIVHAALPHREERVRAQRITIGYEIVGRKDHTTVLLIAGTATHLVRLPVDFCTYLGNEDSHTSSCIIARSASLARPARHQQIGDLRK
jgi:hypothetical protein